MATKNIHYDTNALVEHGYRRVIITITVVLCALLELVDTTIVNVATKTLMGNLGATVSEISWVIASYAIANIIIIPMSGFLSSQFGRKWYFAGSVLLFTFGSFMCGHSSGIWELVFWRFIQGIGGGALMTTSQTILTEIYPKEKLGMAMAMFGMGVILGPTLGPLMGGYIIDHFEWPMLFYVNVPIGLIAFFLTLIFVKDNPFVVKMKSIDWLGIFLLILGIGSLQLFLEQGERNEWFESRFILGVFALSVIGIVGFVWRELTTEHPVVDLRVLTRGNVGLGVSLSFVMGAVLFSTVFIIPIFVQAWLGFTATDTGLMFTPGALFTGFCMPMVGRMLQKGVPSKFLIAIGFGLTAVFVWWCSFLIAPTTSPGNFFWPLMIRGLGMGLLFVPLSNLTLAGLHGKDMQQASGLNNMIRQLGGSIGVAVMGVVLEKTTAQHYNDLISNIASDNILYLDRMKTLTAAFSRFSSDAIATQARAFGVIYGQVFKQASMITYINIFQVLALILVGIIPVVLFARIYKIKPGEVIDAGH
jgi:MFS transporter, DHA2 family, multidrug resistance protein